MATTDRLSGFNIGAAVKPACAVTTTGVNITLLGAQTIDGISVGSCERVLVKDQTDPTENGIYMADNSTWIRARDFDGAKDAIPGTLVYVDRGTLNATSFWAFNSSSTATKITIGTDNVAVSRVTVALSGVTAFSNSLLALASTTAWKSTDGLNFGSAADVDIGNSSTNLGLLTSTGLAWVGIQSWNKGGDLASANSLTLGSTGNYFDVTGGTTINTIGAVRIGTQVGFHFDSTLVLTHSTALVLPSSANIVVTAGDEAEFVQYTTAADWRLRRYLRANGLPLAVLDEDSMVSNSSSHVPTQQSAKAYIDGQVAGVSITRGTVQSSTSSTSIDFTGLPSGLNRVTIMFDGVSANGTAGFVVQIGDSGGLESTGYASWGNTFSGSGIGAASEATGFLIRSLTAANAFSGTMILTRLNGNTWTSMHVAYGSTTLGLSGGGSKTLSEELDRLSVTAKGDTFDAGQINIMYEE
jgi:hypothetical protein